MLSGLVGGRLPRVRLPQPGLGTSSTPSRPLGPTRQPVGAPSTESICEGGAGLPQPPRCSPSGDANGVRFPWAALINERNKWRVRKFGKPRRRHAWVAFELGLRCLELPHLLTWKASPSFTIPPTPMHAVSGLPALNGPAACITVKSRTPPPGGLPSPNGPASLPPPGSGATNGTQTIPPVRLALPPHLARTRTETSTSQRPPVALCALAPEARKGLWLNLGVARAASFGPAPCVTPKPRAQPLRLSWSNWTQVTLVSDSFPCKRKPPLRFAPHP